MRLMQRRQRDETPELREHSFINDDRRYEVDTTVHDAVADSHHPLVEMIVLKPIENGPDGDGMIDVACGFVDNKFMLLPRR